MSLNYKIKTINSDFEVTEIPRIPKLFQKSESFYTYLWVEKSGYTTFDGIDRVAKFFELPTGDINVEGLKDEDGITSQIISIKKVVDLESIERFNSDYFTDNITYIKIKNIIGYGKEAVIEKKLHGNSFRVVVRNLNSETADNLVDYCNSNKHVAFVNYYDNQRFGLPGGPYVSHIIGKAFIDKDLAKIAEEYLKSGNTIPERWKNRLLKTSEDIENFISEINPKKIAFFVSAYNSYLWNKAAYTEISNEEKVKHVNYPGLGDLAIPLSNFLSGKNILECSGYKFVKNSITKVIDQRPYIITTNIFSNNSEDDELHSGKKAVTLSFFLPSGSYATMVIKHLIARL